jgi:hypothetical protein
MSSVLYNLVSEIPFSSATPRHLLYQSAAFFPTDDVFIHAEELWWKLSKKRKNGNLIPLNTSGFLFDG